MLRRVPGLGGDQARAQPQLPRGPSVLLQDSDGREGEEAGGGEGTEEEETGRRGKREGGAEKRNEEEERMSGEIKM